MHGIMNRICTNCGDILEVVVGQPITLTCQKCGCTDGIFDGKDYKKFECRICGDHFVLESNVPVSMGHKKPYCGGTKHIYLGEIPANDKFIQVSKTPFSDVIMVVRNRGLGDVLMVAGTLPFIKKDNPDSSIWFACDEDIFDIFVNNPYVDRVIRTEDHKKYSGVKAVYNFVERLENYSANKEENKKNRIERIFQIAGLGSVKSSEKRPSYFPTESEISWGKQTLGSNKLPTIVVGTEAFASFRAWPVAKTMELVYKLANKYQVVVVGTHCIPGIFGANIINTTGVLKIRELASLIAHSNCVICGDTGLYHLAEALDVPSIPMFGSIPAEARVSTYKFAHPIYIPEASLCIPCWDKQCGPGKENRKCRLEEPDCLKAITVDMVIGKLNTIIRKEKK